MFCWFYSHGIVFLPQTSAAKLGSDSGELSEEKETVAQKRVRTAKDFIRQLEARIGSDDENTEEDEGENC